MYKLVKKLILTLCLFSGLSLSLMAQQATQPMNTVDVTESAEQVATDGKEVKACCAAKVAMAEKNGEEPKACCVAKMAKAENDAELEQKDGEKKACCSAKGEKAEIKESTDKPKACCSAKEGKASNDSDTPAEESIESIQDSGSNRDADK